MTPPATIWLICLGVAILALWAGLVVDHILMARRIRKLETEVARWRTGRIKG